MSAKSMSMKTKMKSFRSEIKITKRKAPAAAAPTEEPSSSEIAKAVPSPVNALPALSYESQANEPTDEVAGIDPLVKDEVNPLTVVIDNVKDVLETTKTDPETMNMSISSASKHSESNMSVSAAEEEVVKEEETVEEVIAVEKATDVVEVAVPVEAVPEAGATDSNAPVQEEAGEEAADEEQACKGDEEDLSGEEISDEPSIEIVQMNEDIHIGFYQLEEETEVGVADVAGLTMEQARGFGARTMQFGMEFGADTLDMGAQKLEQYFSCLNQVDLVEEPSIDTTAGAKKDVMVNVIENTAEGVSIEEEDRNDAVEESPATDRDMSQQEIRV